MSQNLGAARKFVFGAQKPREKFNEMNYTGNKSNSIFFDANDVVRPYCLNIETVRDDDNNQMVETYIRPDAQQFPPSALFQQDGAPLYITCTVYSLLDEMF